MRKLVLGLVASVAMITSAHADWRGHHGHHNQYRGGGGGNEWVVPLVGGLIIGGMIAGSNQGYYQQPRYRNYRQPVCERVPNGYFWNGYQWVPAWETICY